MSDAITASILPLSNLKETFLLRKHLPLLQVHPASRMHFPCASSLPRRKRLDMFNPVMIIYFSIVSLMFPMPLRSLNLPGVGTKYELETDREDTVALFFTKTGIIQMYTLQKGCSKPSVAEMTPVEARRLGNILTGAIIEAGQESVEIAFSALADLRVTIHTFMIPPSIAGKTIEELQIRAKTGATVIAVCRQDKNIVNPPPSFIFEAEDAVLVIGETDQINKFEHEIMVA
jgi:TrkA domain protein